MNWFKRTFGLDLFDLFIHVAVTLVLAGMALESNEEEAFFLLLAGSLLLLGVRRWWNQRGLPPSSVGLSTDQMAAVRLQELEQRMGLLEQSESRIAELEERLDFTERMLAQVSRERLAMLPDHPS